LRVITSGRVASAASGVELAGPARHLVVSTVIRRDLSSDSCPAVLVTVRDVPVILDRPVGRDNDVDEDRGRSTTSSAGETTGMKHLGPG